MSTSDYAASPMSFGRSSRAITPSDTVDIPNGPVKAIVVTQAGTLSILPSNSDVPVAFAEVPAGFNPPFQVRRVLATGTTATVFTVED
jgi:hypothetical protein